MSKPIVAIIGRPNVGKSTLFNRLIRSRKTIVEDIPGVTRDRVYGEATWDERSFIVIDTGGLYPDADEDILAQTTEQSMFAIKEADLIILLFDGKEGLTEIDRQIVSRLRGIKKPVLYVVNKIDTKKAQQNLYDFYELGVEEVLTLSATTGQGVEELIERIIDLLPEKIAQETHVELPKIAVIGRPNVGKSTLINALLGKQRLIVSPTPGTTRDAVDCVCRYYGKEYLFVDTAGVRRKSRISYALERYMVVRAIRSIERSDVAILLIESTEGITEQDQKLAALTQRYGKGLIVAFSKWDLVEDPEKRYNQLMAEFNWKLHFVSYAPVLTLSGLTRRRVTKLFPLIDEVISERKKRVSTSHLNKITTEINEVLPSYRGKKTKIYYITQPEIEPPHFVLFVNYPEAFTGAYLRFIEKKLRENYGFRGTPIRLTVRESS